MKKFITVILCAVLAPAAAIAQDTSPGYSMKGETHLGSNIPKAAVLNSAFPVDKKWSELTPEQQAAFKSQYETIGPNDEPPFPANGLRSIYRPVSEAQNKLMVTGKLSMQVEVDSKGKPVSVSVFESPDPQMTRVVAQILMLQDFKPGVCNGQPCRMPFPFRINMTTSH